MAIGREIEDIARELIRHQHDHPPVRDLNREVERKQTIADRIGADFARLIGSWIFLLAQLILQGDPSTPELLKTYHVSYVLIGPQELSPSHGASASYWAQHGTLVYDNVEYRLYRVSG